MKATVNKVSLGEYERILAISDIHGNLDYLKGLLAKAGFCSKDALVLVGDLTEKGPDSLGVVRYVMQLAKQGNVWAVKGNCDTVMQEILAEDTVEIMCGYMELRRKRWNSYSILWDMCRDAGLEKLYAADPEAFRARLRDEYAQEISFLEKLPAILETEDCVFVHAGLEHENLTELEEWPCLKTDAFASREGSRFAKTVVVGHWPVVLYCRGIARANPVYNAKRNIFSIDGGCMLKYDAQLNCLIRNNADGCWSFESYDDFRPAKALSYQKPSEDPFLFLYGDDEAEVLYEEGSLSRCHHPRTGREMDVPTELLWKDGSGIVHVDNCSDYHLPVRPGDLLSVVLATEKGYIVKKGGVSGWYCGKLVFIE